MHAATTNALKIASTVRLFMPHVIYGDGNSVLLQGRADIALLMRRMRRMYGEAFEDDSVSQIGSNTWFVYAADKSILGTVVMRWDMTGDDVGPAHLEFYRCLDQAEALRKLSDFMQAEALYELEQMYEDPLPPAEWLAVHDFLKAPSGWAVISDITKGKRDPEAAVKRALKLLNITV